MPDERPVLNDKNKLYLDQFNAALTGLFHSLYDGARDRNIRLKVKLRHPYNIRNHQGHAIVDFSEPAKDQGYLELDLNMDDLEMFF